MAVFSDPLFIISVAVIYVGMQLRLPFPRSTWFGLLNCLAVGALFGIAPVLFLLGGSGICWIGITTICRLENGRPKLAFVGKVALYLSVGLALVAYKVWQDPTADLVQALGLSNIVPSQAGRVDQVAEILQTLAFSYVALRAIDVIRAGLAGAPLINPIALSGFLVPFFMTPSGPVNQYEAHVEMDRASPPPPRLGTFIDATFVIILGYFLKFVVAQIYGLFFVGISGAWPTGTLLDTAVFLLFVLIEFSGYSLIALGIGNLLGVATPRNFNHPYLSTSFAEFWTRWHMSLGEFVRRTFYFPIRMALTRALRPHRDNRLALHMINAAALAVPFGFVGLWHRLTANFLLWGLALAAVVAIETIVREEVLSRTRWKLPRVIAAPLGIIYALFMVVLTLQIAAKDFAG